jgi:hypothetical protein
MEQSVNAPGMKLFDPTMSPVVTRPVTLAPRPAQLEGLRIGLVDNRKFNAAPLLLKLADRLHRDHGMTVARMVRKRSASHDVGESAIAELRGRVDFVVSGVGD